MASFVVSFLLHRQMVKHSTNCCAILENLRQTKWRTSVSCDRVLERVCVCENTWNHKWFNKQMHVNSRYVLLFFFRTEGNALKHRYTARKYTVHTVHWMIIIIIIIVIAIMMISNMLTVIVKIKYELPLPPLKCCRSAAVAAAAAVVVIFLLWHQSILNLTVFRTPQKRSNSHCMMHTMGNFTLAESL